MSCPARKYRTMPGTFINCGRIRSMNWLAETSRSPRFFRVIQNRPLAIVWLLPDTPTECEKVSTAGSAATISAIARCFFTMSP
ncbi:hypothetical protein D3C72_1360770 [compost metagenome]